MNMPSPLSNTCVLLVALQRQTAVQCLAQISAPRVGSGFSMPLVCSASRLKRSQPEQTGTVDVVVLKELRPILFRVPVLLALFDERL